MRGIFSTSIVIEDELGETEYDVLVAYEGHAGHKGDYYQPAEPPSIEIIEIEPADKALTVPQHFYEDDGLIVECFADWEAERAEASEWRAQSRRDQLMEGF